MYVQLINIEDEYEINVNMYVLFSVLNYIEHKFTWNKNKSYNITFSDLRSFNFISGVCFYGKTAARVLSILATGNHRLLFPPGKVLHNV